jgi:endonuclease/exonuclease/phosphatase family metal-dependent hydrolase
VKFLLLIIFLTSLSCSQKYSTAKKTPGDIIVMTYNLENLFDTKHDEGKEDYTYLPYKEKQTEEIQEYCMGLPVTFWKEQCLELDWNEKVLNEKMERLAEVILQVNDGEGPDIIFVQEVENLSVLKELTHKYLKGKGYQEVVLIEGPDSRGIDTGLISKFPLKDKAQLHLIGEGAKEQKTRGILQATFTLDDGTNLTALCAHLPSQHGPTSLRIAGVKAINRIRESIPREHIVIAAGDFNITAKEDAQNKLFERYAMKDWYISHYVGCTECSGTHNYRGSWSFLDVMLFSKNLGPKGDSNWELIAKSFNTPNTVRYQVSRFGTPDRFGDGQKASGVSDHFPLIVTLRKRKP